MQSAVQKDRMSCNDNYKYKTIENKDSPDVLYEATKGDRALFSAIITSAIKDAMLFKGPRPASQRGLSQQKHHKLSALMIAANKLISKSKHNPEVCLVLNELVLSKLPLLDLPPTCNNETIAWQARCFINNDNHIFRFYIEMLGLDPQYIEKKVSEYLDKYDQGLVGKLTLDYEMDEIESKIST